jgi:hypothetical protein
MSKFVPIIIGGLEIGAGIALDFLTVAGGNWLIAAGVGTVIGGIGTLLSQPQQGLATASRNPKMPRNVVVGRAKVGGTIVYINESGDKDKYLDLIFVLACHPCQSIDALLFDNQRVLIGPNGNSVRPEEDSDGDQQAINIASITRSNGVVTVVLAGGFTIGIQDGDQIIIKLVSGQATNDRSLNGRYYISLNADGSFTYLSGGFDVSLAGTGQAQTAFPNYREKVHMEVLLGNHASTFPGMLSGTPYDAGGQDDVTVENNPWTAQHLLLGCTCVFLRLHYNDEVFASGLPQISFRIHGKNDILDPRTGTTGYTENPALIIADYLKDQTWGFKANDNEVPTAPLIAAANICDEPVELASGVSEPRYTCNGNFPLSMKRGEILRNLLTSCGGRLTYSGGQFVINPAAWIGTAVQMYQGFSSPTGSPAVSATLSILTSHVQGTPSAASVMCSIDGLSLFNRGWMTDSGAWTLRTNTTAVPLDTLFSLHVLFAVGTGLGIIDLTSPDQFLVYDCSVDVMFADGTTATFRPATAEIDLTWTDGSISDAANAVDGDPSTAATIERTHLNTLDFSPVLRLSNFDFPSQTDILTPKITPLGDLGKAAGAFRWKSKLAIRDLFNGVKGTYVSPANGWQASDFPPYAQDQLHGYASGSPMFPEGDANMAADGGDRRWKDVQLPFTISPSMAQRLAKIELLRGRQQGMGTFVYNMSLYGLTALDIVEMTVLYLGWVNKLLEISAHRLTVNRQQVQGGGDVMLLGCEIDVQEADASVYDWSATEELTPQGFQQSSLPDTSKPAKPTAATVTSDATTASVGADGIATSRILVSWTAPVDGYVTNGGHIEVQYQPASSPAGAVWTPVGKFDPTVTQAYIDGVTDGTDYSVRIRSVNAAGVPSDWVDAGTVTAGGSSFTPHLVFNEKPAGAYDGVNQTYALTHAPSPALSLDLSLNGDLQLSGVDFTLTGDTITLLIAHPNVAEGDWMRASYWY